MFKISIFGVNLVLMKNHIIAITLNIFVISCGRLDNSFVIFSGKINNTAETIIKVSNYNNEYRKTIPINSSGWFKDTLFIDKSGYYYFQIGKSYTTVKFKNGWDLHLNIDADDFFNSISYTGKGSIENNYNVSRQKLKAKFVGVPKEYFVVPIKDFLAKINNNREAYLQLLNNSSLAESDKKIERRIIEYDYLLTRNNYQKFYSYHKGEEPVLPEYYYDPIREMDIDDGEIFRYSKSYRVLIVEYWRLLSQEAMEQDSNLTAINFVEKKIRNINSIDIKEQFVSMLFRQISLKNENYREDYPKIMDLLSTDKMRTKLTDRFNSINSTKPDMPSTNFYYENFAGGYTSLNDLKGKLSYIEIWATWCGPCIREMPALTQLIKEYKDKDIEFISISIDSKNDYDKWRKMVPEKNVGGIQLFSDKGLDSDFMKAFNVGLIPRSIMLDANGNIITDKAPRPSSADIKPFIDKYLKKTIRFSS